MLSTNSLSAHLEDLIQTLRDSTHHGLLALPSPLHHFQHLEQFRNLTQRHIAKFPSLQVIPSRSGSGSGSGGSWRRAIRLENLEINDRAIDARSAVTIAIFFIVSESLSPEFHFEVGMWWRCNDGWLSWRGTAYSECSFSRGWNGLELMDNRHPGHIPFTNTASALLPSDFRKTDSIQICSSQSE